MINSEKMVVNGKVYEASYFGEQDLSLRSDVYAKREFWRLENAYEDFQKYKASNQVLPYNNYPMSIEQGQVFVVDFSRKDGVVERHYFRSDGVIWQDMPSTSRFWIEPIRMDVIIIKNKEYKAAYYGEQDLSEMTTTMLKREFWRLENSYDDFKECQTTGQVLPYNNYPVDVDIRQVFVIDYTKHDGTIERQYYRSDGTIWQDMPSTNQFEISKKI